MIIDYRAMVSLTYDDGLDSQVKHALPALNEFGLKGTFFVSGEALKNPARYPAWRGVAAAGHEIGIHTINHPCDISFDFVPKGFALQDYDMARMREEIDENLRIVKDEFNYKSDKYVFAYPCGQSSLGKNREISYKPLIKEKFSAARGVQSIYADPISVDLYDVPCFGVECNGGEMIEMVKKAAQNGVWLVFLFHGIEGDYISVTEQAHRELVEYLSHNKDTILTDTFGNISSRISAKR